MRDSDEPVRGTWAEYIREARKRLRMAPTAFGIQVGDVRRQTVYAWEDGRSVPNKYEIIAAVARGLGDDVSVALRAAGVEAGTGADAARRRDEDEEALRSIRKAPVSPRVKAVLEGHLERMRTRHEAERIAEIEEQIRLQIELENPRRPGKE